MSPSRTVVLAQRLALQSTTLATALMFALAVTAMPAAAQQRSDDADDATQTLDQVNVTGTHLRRVDAETASPVVVIDRQRIEDSGQSTLGQLLQRLPMMAGFQTGPALNSNFSHGRALVSLRNLGPERTLVLVNGHRMAGPASSVASAPGVDVNAIPAAMVERVEVLTDGASSVYGPMQSAAWSMSFSRTGTTVLLPPWTTRKARMAMPIGARSGWNGARPGTAAV